MTLCMPRKPFEVFGQVLCWLVITSWIPITVWVVATFIKENEPSVFVFLFFGAAQLCFFIVQMIDLNEQKHWIKWCDK